MIHGQGRRSASIAAAVLALALASIGATSGGATSLSAVGLAQLGLERWSTDQGLAGAWVRDLARTDDGFLWVATSRGLSRLDGARFVNFTTGETPDLPANSVQALAASPGARLWVGFEFGGVRRYEGGAFRTDPRLAALPDRPVRALVEASDGTLWVGTDSGLWKMTATDLEPVAPPEVRQEVEVRGMHRSVDGGLLVRTLHDGLWRVEEKAVLLEPDAPGCEGFDVAEGPDGSLYTACRSGLWRKLPGDETWTRITQASNLQRIHVDRSGVLWYGSDQGLVRWTPEGDDLLSPARGLGDYRVRAFLDEGPDDLWIGTFSGGLARLHRGAVEAIGATEGLPIRASTGVLARPDGSLWVGTTRWGAFLWSPSAGIERTIRIPGEAELAAIWTIEEDPRAPERLWLGTEQGLIEASGERLRWVERPEGRTREAVLTLYLDPVATGTLWAGGRSGGLDEIRGERVVRHDERNGLGLGRVAVLRRTRDGALLAGGPDGLFRMEGTRWREVVLPGDRARDLRDFFQQDDGTLWLASDRSGLLRWRDGNLTILGERQGLPFNSIYSLQPDGDGNLWLNGDEGLVRLHLRDFDRWARGELALVPRDLIGARDGMRDRECNGWGFPRSTRLPDGRVVYPTMSGLAVLDPSRIEQPRIDADRIAVDAARTGSRTLDPNAPMRLTTAERALHVRFTVPEFARPEAVVFRYRLEGLDREWVLDSGAREAVYSYVPPGRYRFRVQARDAGGEWVEASASPEVSVAPRLWESEIARAAVVALLLAAASAAYLWRRRVRHRHLAALRSERRLLREVIDTSPHPIFAKDRSGTFWLANRAAAEVYGLTPKELVGSSDREVAERARGVEKVDALDRLVIEQARELSLPEVQIVDQTGAPRWFRVLKRPLVGPSGEVDQVLGTAVDVTEYKMAEIDLRAHRERLQQLASRLLRVQEEERSRLAREIHDDLTQRIAGLAMLTGAIAGRLEAEPPAHEELLKIGAELERLASDTQAVARELHPALLERLGLAEALRSECATFGARTGLQIRFDCGHPPTRLGREASLALYRIVQEALRNVVTHSESATAVVTLEEGRGQVRLSVADSGRGFESERLERGPSLGIESMRERARLIGAELEIDTAPGKGTKVLVRSRADGSRRARRPTASID